MLLTTTYKEVVGLIPVCFGDSMSTSVNTVCLTFLSSAVRLPPLIQTASFILPFTPLRRFDHNVVTLCVELQTSVAAHGGRTWGRTGANVWYQRNEDEGGNGGGEGGEVRHGTNMRKGVGLGSGR